VRADDERSSNISARAAVWAAWMEAVLGLDDDSFVAAVRQKYPRLMDVLAPSTVGDVAAQRTFLRHQIDQLGPTPERSVAVMRKIPLP